MKPAKGFYLKLFAATFRLSAFTFGGGYVIVPLMKKRFVEDYKWIDETEMMDLVTISQSAPGPIAVNASILTGYHLAGTGGAFCALAGTILPPLIILSVVSLFYAGFKENIYVNAVLRGMSAGVAAVVADAVIKLAVGVAKTKNTVSITIMTASFLAVFLFSVDIKLILLAAALVGLATALLGHYHHKKRSGTP